MEIAAASCHLGGLGYRSATSRMVPGSIPGGVNRVFPWFLPTKPCALRSTQSLKMCTRDFSWGKGGRCF
jgi:hypothetical protein